jgi:Mn2+/Fe2+ NRAMP family transporter
LVYSGKKSQKQRFLIENKSKSADGIIIKEIKDKKKSWSNAYTWLSAILATIFTAGAIFTGIKFGFNLGLFTIWLVVMLFISFEWLIHTLSTKDMFRVVVYLLITLAIILFAASIEKVSFLDAIRTYIGKYVNFDYFIGALGIYGLAISIAAIYEDYKDRKKI